MLALKSAIYYHGNFRGPPLQCHPTALLGIIQGQQCAITLLQGRLLSLPPESTLFLKKQS